jgi:hypothetical protein
MTKKPENPVGYCKPPVSDQFKPGQSGNPKGRPKGRKSPALVIADLFSRKITILEGGKKKKVSQMEALGRRVLNDGLKGNAKATDQALTLLKIMSSLQSDSAQKDDGTLPDASADLRAVQALLKHHDVSMDNEDDEDD